MLHPNEDPSEISQFNGTPRGGRHNMNGDGQATAVKLGWFKQMVVWIDEHWLKPLLVNKNQD